jgi:hypothetical protein
MPFLKSNTEWNTVCKNNSACSVSDGNYSVFLNDKINTLIDLRKTKGIENDKSGRVSTYVNNYNYYGAIISGVNGKIAVMFAKTANAWYPPQYSWTSVMSGDWGGHYYNVWSST